MQSQAYTHTQQTTNTVDDDRNHSNQAKADSNNNSKNNHNDTFNISDNASECAVKYNVFFMTISQHRILNY